MWIGQQQAVAGAAQVAPDGDGVAAGFRVGQRLAEALQIAPQPAEIVAGRCGVAAGWRQAATCSRCR